MFELGSKIQSQVQSEMDKGQREYFLRQQLKAIQQELGETDPEQAEIAELRERLEALGELPKDVQKAADRELARLEKLPSAAAEYGVIRTYLEWILSLPWSRFTEDDLDLEHARSVLDADHFDLEKVKDRIIEYLAVAKLRNQISGQILCFVGPPGVGKTSLGHSIANALGRKFVRLSVGGVRDEAEIRGHRRTYIGSMPGSIIRSLRDAESSNPLLLIDEIDKMGGDWRGDPASAMLEVLDPEQNQTFRDHYLDLPFDLSKVLFICTANTLDTIPGAAARPHRGDPALGLHRGREARDREAVPAAETARGARPQALAADRRATRCCARSSASYTREAGVRGLERRLADLCRKAATQVAKGKTHEAHASTTTLLREWLGPRRFSGEVRKRTSEAGVATGLAYTAVGGDVLFIEATAYPGKGRLTITGQLGEVMQESAQAALSWVRAHADSARVPTDWFAEHDVHIHVPAGAVPKDGPSAGVTMATAIASLVRGSRSPSDVGMTGEITLTGQVLPIGGHSREVARRAARRVEARHHPARERARPRRAAAGDAQARSSSSPRTRSKTCSRLRSTERVPTRRRRRARGDQLLGRSSRDSGRRRRCRARRQSSWYSRFPQHEDVRRCGRRPSPVGVRARRSAGDDLVPGECPAARLREPRPSASELLSTPGEKRGRVRLDQREVGDLHELRIRGWPRSSAPWVFTVQPRGAWKRKARPDDLLPGRLRLADPPQPARMATATSSAGLPRRPG